MKHRITTNSTTPPMHLTHSDSCEAYWLSLMISRSRAFSLAFSVKMHYWFTLTQLGKPFRYIPGFCMSVFLPVGKLVFGPWAGSLFSLLLDTFLARGHSLIHLFSAPTKLSSPWPANLSIAIRSGNRDPPSPPDHVLTKQENGSPLRCWNTGKS